MATYTELVRAAAETIVTDAGGYDDTVAQTLEHDNTGKMVWVDKA